MPANRTSDAEIQRNRENFFRPFKQLSWLIGQPVDPRVMTTPAKAGNYTVNGVTYEAGTHRAINPDTGKSSSGGYSIDPSSGKRTDYASGADRGAGLSAGGTGRNVERVSRTGVVQKGTQTSPASTPIDMSKGFDQLLAEMGLTDYYNGEAFTSNQLPTTDSNPFSANSTPKTAAFNPAAPGITGNTYDNYGSEGGASAASQPLIDGNEQFNPNAPRIEGGSTAPSDSGKGYKTITADDPIAAKAFGKDWVESNKGKGESKGRSMAEALSDTSGMRVDSENLRELRARAAFLDAPDSMTGLKRAQAVRKNVYAGGQHYIPDGDGKQAISKEDARRLNSGQIGAAALLQEYKDKITASSAQKPAEVGNSTNPSKPEGSDPFSPGKSQDTEPYNPGKGAPLANSQSKPGNPGPAIDFDNNNNQGDPGFDTDEDLLGGSRVRIPLNGGAFGG